MLVIGLAGLSGVGLAAAAVLITSRFSASKGVNADIDRRMFQHRRVFGFWTATSLIYFRLVGLLRTNGGVVCFAILVASCSIWL